MSEELHGFERLASDRDPAINENEARDLKRSVFSEHVCAHACDHHNCVYPALTASNLSYGYPKEKTPVFSGVRFEAHAGSVLAVLGNNGAGKSTLLNILAGTVKATEGQAMIAGRDIAQMGIREVARHVAYVSQQQRIPHLTVYDQVLLGRRPHITWGISDHDRLVVSRTIEQMGLGRYSSRFLDELSGGERQKVHLARALAQEPEVLLLDEPTSALDPKNQMEVLEIVGEITKARSLATVIVMHDINLALRFCDRFLLMHDGTVIAYGGGEVVTDKTLSSTYDYSLRIESIDETLVAVPVRLPI